MPFYQAFMRILGEGRPLGVHVVATADRSGSVPTAVSSNVSRRVVLRLSDENAYALLECAEGRARRAIGARTRHRRRLRDPDRRARRDAERGRADQAAHPVGSGTPCCGRPRGRRDRRRFPHGCSPRPIAGSHRRLARARRRRGHARRARLRSHRHASWSTGPPLSGKTNAMKALVTVDGALRSRRATVPLRWAPLAAQGLRAVDAQRDDSRRGEGPRDRARRAGRRRVAGRRGS